MLLTFYFARGLLGIFFQERYEYNQSKVFERRRTSGQEQLYLHLLRLRQQYASFVCLILVESGKNSKICKYCIGYHNVCT